MNKKVWGEAILATLITGTPILENILTPREDHFHIHFDHECIIPNIGIGVNPYNIVNYSLIPC